MQSPILARTLRRKSDRDKREGECVIPGEIWWFASGLPASRGRGDEPPEVSSGHNSSRERSEGPNVKHGSRTADLDASREAEAYASKAGAEVDGRSLSRAVVGAEARTATGGETKPEAAQGLLEAALERSNMMRAYQRVVENKGAPGVDGLTVLELKPWLQAHWPKIKQALLAGGYMPRAVRKVEIPKPARRGTHPGHSLCAGSPDPTGTSSDIATSVRSRVL